MLHGVGRESVHDDNVRITRGSLCQLRPNFHFKFGDSSCGVESHNTNMTDDTLWMLSLNSAL